MNRVARTFLNLMRVEVLLGIGLVLWVFSVEAKAQTWVCEIKDEQRIYNKNTSTEWADILSKAHWLDQPIINKSTNQDVIVSIFDGKSTAASEKAIPIVAQGKKTDPLMQVASLLATLIY